MLTANMDNGKRISLAPYSRKELLLLKKHSFTCPDCGDFVILKIGETVVPHFAHKSLSACFGFSEPESTLHLNAKKELFHWLIQQNESPQMEQYTPDKRQKADIFVKNVHGRFAIEYQSSPIALQSMLKRTIGYKSVNIMPQWIFGCTSKNRKKFTTPITSLKESHLLFLQYNKQYGFWFPTFTPNTSFLFVFNPFPLSATKYIIHSQEYQKSDLKIPLSPPKYSPKMDKNLFTTIWLKEKNAWLRQKVVSRKKKRDLFLDLLYKDGYYPYLLPEYIGVPVEFMITIKTHPIIWQYFVWRDSFIHKKEKDLITLGDILVKFEQRVKKQFIQIRQLPLCANIDYRQAVYQYIQILKRATILIEVKNNTFKLLQGWSPCKSEEEARKKEKGFFLRQKHILKLFSVKG
ncbi:competence protein CoiA family protein [Bacillus spongiae]|uniref:Competence protein CoiA family protein n=1 Tax=Bacillus spongiae TaxID=2683610 RepID=A0ABU8HBK6_9BACI